MIANLCIYPEHLSMMMRQVFETHQPSIPIEELLKAAATGDVQTVDEVNYSLLVFTKPVR